MRRRRRRRWRRRKDGDKDATEKEGRGKMVKRTRHLRLSTHPSNPLHTFPKTRYQHQSTGTQSRSSFALSPSPFLETNCPNCNLNLRRCLSYLFLRFDRYGESPRRARRSPLGVFGAGRARSGCHERMSPGIGGGTWWSCWGGRD